MPRLGTTKQHQAARQKLQRVKKVFVRHHLFAINNFLRPRVENFYLQLANTYKISAVGGYEMSPRICIRDASVVASVKYRVINYGKVETRVIENLVPRELSITCCRWSFDKRSTISHALRRASLAQTTKLYMRKSTYAGCFN